MPLPVPVPVHVLAPALTLALTLTLTACSKTPTSPTPTPTPGASPSATTSHSPAADAPLGVELRVDPAGAGFAPVLVQRGTSPISVDGSLAVEHRHADHWEPVAATLGLRANCASPIPTCLQLVPGAELHPPPWPARLGASQCGCGDCAPAPAGEYRFVVRGCDGGASVESSAFQVR